MNKSVSTNLLCVEINMISVLSFLLWTFPLQEIIFRRSGLSTHHISPCYLTPILHFVVFLQYFYFAEWTLYISEYFYLRLIKGIGLRLILEHFVRAVAIVGILCIDIWYLSVFILFFGVLGKLVLNFIKLMFSYILVGKS